MRDCTCSDPGNHFDSFDVDHIDVEFFCGRIGNSKNERLGWVSMTTQENDRKMVLDAINLCDKIGVGRDDFFLWTTNLATLIVQEIGKIRNQVKRETLSEIDVEFNDDGGFDVYFEMFVLYDNPLDHPGSFVLRKWILKFENPRPCEEILLKFEAETRFKAIEYVNNHFKNTKVFLQRSETDDECIVGTWI